MPTNLKTPTFDTIDIKIIKILSDNARTSASSIATEIGMSPPSVSERIKRLTETGIIRKFTIELNPELIGYPFSAIVRIKPLPGKIHILQQRLIGLDNCIQCDKVTGEDCFIAKLVLQSIPELDDVLESIVELAQTSTAIIKKSPVHNRLPALY
ncbi:MAG: Lrp/AsnC family transcriptional regulator [Oceanospirillaceae bacterium]|nr:Lrp/AsnC family transcriptional regulator [Oceanospirillaceae bacterium]